MVVELVQCLCATVIETMLCSAALEVVRRDLKSVPLSIVLTTYSVGFLKF